MRRVHNRHVVLFGGNGKDQLVIEEGIDIVFDPEPAGLAYRRG